MDSKARAIPFLLSDNAPNFSAASAAEKTFLFDMSLFSGFDRAVPLNATLQTPYRLHPHKCIHVTSPLRGGRNLRSKFRAGHQTPTQDTASWRQHAPCRHDHACASRHGPTD